MVKRALITGITGQDGSFLAELLLEKGYEVHGIVRRSSNFNTKRIEHIYNRLQLHYGDLTDFGNIFMIIQRVNPSEIYNLAAMSHVKVSFELESYTFQTNTLGVLNIIQSVKMAGLSTSCKIYQASTSEMYGNTTDGSTPLHENSLMLPVSPYGISKLAAHHICNYYRDAYNMFIVSSVLLNHESERRGDTFVTKKITNWVKKYDPNTNAEFIPLQLGNLDAMRDWGYAKDYVEGIWMMMQHNQPKNYVLATGEMHSVREFVVIAFELVGVRIEWRGKGEQEVGIDRATGKVVVAVNSKFYRPIDVEALIGDYTTARETIGWTPKTSFGELVRIMLESSE